MNSGYAVPAVALVVVATVLVGAFGLRISRTTSDFYVASRTVGPRLNAAAISGEYLSAASFLGIAGLVLVQGPDMLWYPVGYTAGYLVLLLFVAAPLRRSGAYTLPDFAEARLASRPVRRLAGAFVVGVGWLYLLPQLQGAGLTLTVLTGAPDSLGGVIVAVVVTATVAAGGMRSITFVQAFQYWLKLTALLVPALFLVLAWQGDGAPRHAFAEPATFREQRAVRVDDTVDLTLEAPLTVTVTGTVDGRRHDATALRLPAGTHRIERGTRLTFARGAAVPAADRSADGTMSASLAAGRAERPLYATYGLILATFLGTMGLPHVVVRFYTSPHGVAARRTTVAVLALIGCFYLLPPLYGALGRLYAPELALTGDADAAVLLLPDRMIGGPGGDLLGALVAGGAFAAFLSTASGLTMAVAGVLTQDVLPSRGVRHFRLGTGLAMAVPLAAGVVVGGCRSRTPSGSPSRCRRPRSARCWSSASGGGGSPRPAPPPGCWPAAARRSSPWPRPWPACRPPGACTPCSPGPPCGRCRSASSPWSWCPWRPRAASRRARRRCWPASTSPRPSARRR